MCVYSARIVCCVPRIPANGALRIFWYGLVPSGFLTILFSVLGAILLLIPGAAGLALAIVSFAFALALSGTLIISVDNDKHTVEAYRSFCACLLARRIAGPTSFHLGGHLHARRSLGMHGPVHRLALGNQLLEPITLGPDFHARERFAAAVNRAIAGVPARRVYRQSWAAWHRRSRPVLWRWAVLEQLPAPAP